MKNKYEIRGEVTAIIIIRKGQTHETLIDTTDLAKSLTIPSTILATPSRDKRTMYAMCKIDGRYVRFHRFLTDAPDGMEVDHFNHDGLDNRRSSNLRVITSGENNQNLEDCGRVNNKSCGVRGVTYDIETGKWMVQVRLNKKHAYSGRFNTLEEAEIAAKEARAVHLPYSIEAATIVVKDPSKYIEYRDNPKSTNKSGFKYISRNKHRETWKVEIKKLKITRNFEYLSDAIDARNKLLNGQEVPPKPRRNYNKTA